MPEEQAVELLESIGSRIARARRQLDGAVWGVTQLPLPEDAPRLLDQLNAVRTKLDEAEETLRAVKGRLVPSSTT